MCFSFSHTHNQTHLLTSVSLYLVSLVDAVDELLGWWCPGKFDGGGVESNSIHILRGCCGDFRVEDNLALKYFGSVQTYFCKVCCYIQTKSSK